MLNDARLEKLEKESRSTENTGNQIVLNHYKYNGKFIIDQISTFSHRVFVFHIYYACVWCLSFGYLPVYCARKSVFRAVGFLLFFLPPFLFVFESIKTDCCYMCNIRNLFSAHIIEYDCMCACLYVYVDNVILHILSALLNDQIE